jgi:small subunit ribosomal protein S16
VVRIRMKRMGRRNRPFFRINAIDERVKRDGKVLEQLGWYNPIEKNESKQIKLNEERVKFWLSMGAQPSDTLKDILAKRNLIDAEAWKAERASRVARKIADQKAAAAAAPAPPAAAPAAS